MMDKQTFRKNLDKNEHFEVKLNDLSNYFPFGDFLFIRSLEDFFQLYSYFGSS